jgi:hypothetical protein
MWLERMKQGWLRKFLKVSQNIEEKWEESYWHGWEMQRMIYESWSWRDGNKKQIVEKKRYLLQRGPRFLGDHNAKY